MGYGLGGWDSISGGDEVFPFTASRTALRPTQPPIQWAPVAPSLVVNQPGCEADHLSPSNGEVKNGEAIPPLPHDRPALSSESAPHMDRTISFKREEISGLIPRRGSTQRQTAKPQKLKLHFR
jgi:hypothetical protein